MLCILIASIGLFAVMVTHGLMTDDSMHTDIAAECLATVSSVSPATICAPILSPAVSQDLLSAGSAPFLLEDQARPAATAAYARHGPSDLQVFRI